MSVRMIWDRYIINKTYFTLASVGSLGLVHWFARTMRLVVSLRRLGDRGSDDAAWRLRVTLPSSLTPELSNVTSSSSTVVAIVD